MREAFIPIRLQEHINISAGQRRNNNGHTGAKGVVCSFELFAWCEILTLRGNTLEVIGVTLEASPDEQHRPEI